MVTCTTEDNPVIVLCKMKLTGTTKCENRKLDLIFDERTEFGVYQEASYDGELAVHLAGYFQSLRKEVAIYPTCCLLLLTSHVVLATSIHPNARNAYSCRHAALAVLWQAQTQLSIIMCTRGPLLADSWMSNFG